MRRGLVARRYRGPLLEGSPYQIWQSSKKVMGLVAPNFIKRIAWVLPMPSTFTPFTSESGCFENTWQIVDEGKHFRNGGRVSPERAVEVAHSIC